MKQRGRVMIAVAAYGGVKDETVACLGDMAVDVVSKSNHGYTRAYVFNGFICGAREELVKHAQKEEATHILFIDADMITPEQLPVRLMDLSLAEDLPIVAGLYAMRNHPHFHVIYKKHPELEGKFQPILVKPETYGGLLKADATGFGCCLIRMDVFDKVPEPWFALESKGTEDIYFFKKANKEGYDVVIDTGLCCGHIGKPVHVWPSRQGYHVPTENCGAMIFADEEVLAQEGVEVEDIVCEGAPPESK
jgi:hypothetical protein